MGKKNTLKLSSQATNQKLIFPLDVAKNIPCGIKNIFMLGKGQAYWLVGFCGGTNVICP